MFGHGRDELIGRSARLLFPESALPVTIGLSAVAGLDRPARGAGRRLSCVHFSSVVRASIPASPVPVSIG